MSTERFEELLEYLEGELPVARVQVLERELETSPALRAELERVRRLTGRLREADPRLAEVDLVPSLQAALAEAPRSRARGGRRWAAAGAALALAAGLVLFVALPRGGDDGFRPKGSSTTGSSWVGIEAWRFEGTAPAGRLGSRMKSGESLGIAYTNRPEGSLPYLMVFAVDSQRQVFWLVPEWSRPDDDPQALAIEARPGRQQLPVLVHHDFAPGRVTLHGLFTRDPLRVSEVERRLKAGLPPGGDGAVEQQIVFEVER